MKAIGGIKDSRAPAWIALTIVGMGTVSAGSNVWTSIGPYGGSARMLAIDPQNPDTVYAVTSGGMFKTTNGGASWTGASSGLGWVAGQSGAVLALAIDPQNSNIVYAGGICRISGFCGVFKSTDGGTNWNQINSGLEDSELAIESLSIDPQNPATVYAGTSAGVFKTTNGGASWTGASSGLPSGKFGAVFALAIDPQTSTTAYAGAFGSVFKTTDGGATWSEAKSGLPCCDVANALIVDPRHPSTIYGTAVSGTVIKSTDGGVSWSAARTAGTAFCCGSFTIDLQSPNVVYLGGDYGVLKSTDGGKTWADTGLPRPRDNGGPMGLPGVIVAADPKNPGTVYATTDGLGVFKSTDGASSWSAVNSGLAAAGVDSFAIDPRNPGTIYAVSNAGLVKTTNGGANWNAADSGLPTVPISLAVDPQNSSTIYAGVLPTVTSGTPSGPGGIFKSVDGGANWSAAGPAPTGGYFNGILAIDPQNPSTVYAGHTSGTLLKSTDGGTSWTQTAFGNNIVAALAIDPQNPSTLYVADWWQEFKSTDGGASWSNLGVPIDSIGDCDECLAIGVVSVDPRNSSTLYAAGSVGVMKSRDGGTSWNAMNSGLPWSPANFDLISALVIDPQNSNTVYVAIAGRVFKSTDGAASWSEVNSGITVNTLALDPKDPSTLYAGTSFSGISAITFTPAPIGVALQQAIAAMKTAPGTDTLNFWQWAWFWQYLPAFNGAPPGFGVVGSISPDTMEQIIVVGGGDPRRNISAEQWVVYFRQVVPQ